MSNDIKVQLVLSLICEYHQKYESSDEISDADDTVQTLDIQS